MDEIFKYIPFSGASEQAPNMPQKSSFTSIADFLGVAINILMGITFAAGFVSIAYSLVQLVISRGDPKSTSTAFKTFTWGVAAVVISFIVIVIKNIIVNMIGIKGIDNVLPNF